jgi:hypothetical protein
MRLADVALVLWIALWIAVGFAVAHEVRALSELSGTVTEVGQATRQVGGAVESIGDLPLVGDRVGQVGASVERAGASAVHSGRTSGRSVRRLSVLLGIALAAIPIAPVLAIYLPARVRWWRERRALSAVRAAADDDPRFELWLARRGLERLPYRRIAAVAERPWEPADERTAHALAHEELRRLGLGRGRS